MCNKELNKDLKKKLNKDQKYKKITFKQILKAEYNCIYIKGKNNSYTALENTKGKCGIYFFADSAQMLYVGEAHKQDLYTRIQQHFRDNDTGGLRTKLEAGGKKF